MSVRRRKMIIDCDTGVDDSLAILIALEAESLVDVIAITCVNGNCTVDNAVRNSLITTKMAGKNIPVYRGANKPLNIWYTHSEDMHGNDGLGGVAHKFQPNEVGKQEEHAVSAMVRLVQQYPGEITLVAVGPLTNLAMAYRMDDDFSAKLDRLVVMGGNTEGKGNIKLATEFNFHVDPLAAQIVMEETECPCSVIGWETSGLYDTMPIASTITHPDRSVKGFPVQNTPIVQKGEWYDSIISQVKTKRGAFIREVHQQLVQKNMERYGKEKGFASCDGYAIMVAIYPDIVTKRVEKKVTVETAGLCTSGLMVVDWADRHFPRPNVKPRDLILKIDSVRMKQIYEQIMK